MSAPLRSVVSGGGAAEVDGTKRKKTIAIGSVLTPIAAIPSSTTSPPPMKRISRWPARMFAKSRTESEMTRTKCEMTSMMKMGATAGPSTPAGTQLFK